MFEEGAEELRKLIRAVQAFEIPTPVVTDGQPQRIEFTRQNINDMSTIYNTYKRIRGEMGVTARYPELLQQIQLLILLTLSVKSLPDLTYFLLSISVKPTR